MKLRSRFIYYLALSVAVVIWGSSFPALKIALSEFSPSQVLAGRMLTSTLLCLPVARSLWHILREDRKVLRVLLFAVLCEPCIYFLFEGYALRFTTASQAGLVMSVLPAAVALGAWLFLRERLPLATWLGFAVSFAGVLALSFGAQASESAPNPLLGNFLELMAILCGSAYVVSAKYLSRRLNAVQLTAAMSYAGALFFSALCLLPQTLEPVTLEVALPSWMPLACVIYLGAAVMFLGYGLYNFALTGMPAGQATAFMNLVPVCSLLMGVLFLQEHMTLVQYGAAALVVGGVALSQMPGRSRKGGSHGA